MTRTSKIHKTAEPRVADEALDQPLGLVLSQSLGLAEPPRYLEILVRKNFVAVLTYIYPHDPQNLSLDSLEEILFADGFAVVEREIRNRAVPTWTYLLLSHKSSRCLRYKFVFAANSKSNVDWVAERYLNNRNVEHVRNAKKYIWCQIVAGDASDREFSGGFDSFNRIVTLIARLSKGVVDLPEDERLYSSAGFSRYLSSKSSGKAKSK